MSLLWLDDVSGESLEAWRAHAQPDWRAALPVAKDLAEAVRSLHARHVLHLALQPGHVLMAPDSRVRVIDFQQARRIVHKEPLPVDEADLDGALAYLFPEQTGRVTRTLDERADLYALGATLYFLFTGQPPHRDQSPMALVHAHLARRLVPPSQVQADLPTPLSDLVLRLLQKEPDARYHSAAAVVADLATCLDHLTRHGNLSGVVRGRENEPLVLPAPPRLYGDDRSSPHSLLLPTACAVSFLRGESCFAAVGFTRPFSWPEPSAPQGFCLSGELPASAARFLAALTARSIAAPHASRRKTRADSGILALTCPQIEHVFVDGEKRGATTNRDPYHWVL